MHSRSHVTIGSWKRGGGGLVRPTKKVNLLDTAFGSNVAFPNNRQKALEKQKLQCSTSLFFDICGLQA